MKDQIEKLGIIGAGQMGTGIAQVALGRGFTVQLSDCSEDALSRARALIDKGFAKWVEKSKMDAGQAEQALGRLTLLHELEALQSAEMVIEAASEQEALKLDLFCRLSNICSPDCILATNTSSVPVTRIASVVDGPHRVIGMHFMNPVPLMQLVEVIRALQSDDATTQTVCAVAKRLGKTPVEVKDGFGFVANRILLPMINEAIYVRYEQLAEVEAIDEIMRLGMNHPVGPLRLADMIGLDTCLAIMEVLSAGFGDSKYRPCPLLRQMVDAGYLGRKSGRGFYDYSS